MLECIAHSAGRNKPVLAFPVCPAFLPLRLRLPPAFKACLPLCSHRRHCINTAAVSGRKSAIAIRGPH